MGFKSQNTKDTLNKLKLKKDSKKEMKNHKTLITVLVTLSVTLFVLATLAATFYAGTQYQQERHDSISEAKADAVAAALKTSEQQ